MPPAGLRRHLREIVEAFLSFCNEFILFLQVFRIRHPHAKAVSAKGQACTGKDIPHKRNPAYKAYKTGKASTKNGRDAR